MGEGYKRESAQERVRECERGDSEHEEEGKQREGVWLSEEGGRMRGREAGQG